MSAGVRSGSARGVLQSDGSSRPSGMIARARAPHETGDRRHDRGVSGRRPRERIRRRLLMPTPAPLKVRRDFFPHLCASRTAWDACIDATFGESLYLPGVHGPDAPTHDAGPRTMAGLRPAGRQIGDQRVLRGLPSLLQGVHALEGREGRRHAPRGRPQTGPRHHAVRLGDAARDADARADDRRRDAAVGHVR
jgi:hypothetical protein